MPNPAIASPRRSWFALSLRSLMLLVVVVALVIGWEIHLVRTQQRAVAIIRAHQGEVLYDFQFDLQPERYGQIHQNREPAAPAWLRRWLGDDLFQTVVAVDLQVDWLDEAEEAQALGALGRLQSLTLGGWPNLDPALLAEATRSPHLARLHLRGLVEGRQHYDGSIPAILATVGRIASLREVVVEEFYGDGTDLAELGRLPMLKSLTIGSGAGLTDEGLARGLAALKPSLRSVQLAGGAITLGTMSGPESVPQTLATLATHHLKLARLDLREIPLSPADYAMIGRLTHLTSLTLDPIRRTPTATGFATAPADTPNTDEADPAANRILPADEAMRPLAALTELANLTLFSLNLTDEGLRHLAPLRRLRRLRVDSPKLTDAALATIGKFVDLEALTLRSARIGDARLSDLAPLTRLKGLTLGAGVTDAGVPALAKLTALESLGLGGSALTDAALVPLAGLPRLTMLVLVQSSVTPAGVRQLQATRPDLTVQATIGGKFRAFLAPNQQRINAARAAANRARAAPNSP